jgi:ATP-dependent Clp protease ATP-binding subunit ClpC
MFDRFTAEARQAVMRAQEESRLMHHGHVGTEHFLVALAQEPELARLGLDRQRARAEVVKTVGLGDVDPELHGQIPFTAAAKEALNDALGEAMRLGQGQIRPGHLLLAVLKQREPDFQRRRDDLGAIEGIASVGGMLAPGDGDGAAPVEAPPAQAEPERGVEPPPVPAAAAATKPASSKRERRRQRRASRPHGRPR